MKFGPLTKLEKRNNTTSKKSDDDVMSTDCDVIVIFSDLWPICSNPEGGFRRIVCKTFIFINSNLLSYKSENRTKNLKYSSHIITLSKDTIFAKNC